MSSPRREADRPGCFPAARRPTRRPIPRRGTPAGSAAGGGPAQSHARRTERHARLNPADVHLTGQIVQSFSEHHVVVFAFGKLGIQSKVAVVRHYTLTDSTVCAQPL